MYKYHHPKPIIIKLTDELGFELRQKAAEYITQNQNITGAERGSKEEQGFGALAEIVVRNKLGMPEVNPEDHPLGYDILLPSGVKLDVKCRGGSPSFEEKKEMPGTKRQKKWVLYVCGWVSKERVIREGVYLPRGSLTEQGRTWFTYRGQEIEFYNRNLNGLETVEDLTSILPEDVERDKQRKGDLNLTSVDALRITYDLIGRGILSEKHLAFIQKEISLDKNVKPILHANQYFHLLKWLQEKGQLTERELQKAKEVLKEELFDGI